MGITKAFCECGDTGCPHCGANCTDQAAAVLYRVDMIDVTGTLMCDACTEDAVQSGLFEVDREMGS